MKTESLFDTVFKYRNSRAYGHKCTCTLEMAHHHLQYINNCIKSLKVPTVLQINTKLQTFKSDFELDSQVLCVQIYAASEDSVKGGYAFSSSFFW